MNKIIFLCGFLLLFAFVVPSASGTIEEPPLKITVASDGDTIDAMVAAKGARGGYLQFFDENGKWLETIENPYYGQMGSAGTSCAYMIAEKGTTVFVAGMVGSKMVGALDANEIEFVAFEGTVKEAVEFVLSR